VGPQADQIQALQSERADLSNRLASLQAENSRLPGNPNQTELLRLRGEMARARQESDAAKAPVTETMVATRYRNAQDLARQGDPAGALKEFLWCFDEGMTRFPAYSGVRTSFLLSSIAALGKDYPSALTALRERRDRAAQLLINGGNDSSTAMDFSALNRALDEDGNSLALFDQLPADAAGRKTLALLLFDKLVEAQRYGDALAGRTYSQMRLIVELGKVEVPVTSPHAETILKTQRDSIIKNSLVAIEALAGGGELEHAREFAGQLLQYDDSPNTRDQLHQHLTRAGQPQLLDALPNP